MRQGDRFTVRGVDPDLARKLRVLAAGRDMTMGELMNEMIKYYIYHSPEVKPFVKYV